MALSLKAENLKRYKDIVALLVKYGRSDLVKQARLQSVPGDGTKTSALRIQPKAEELAEDLEKLGARRDRIHAAVGPCIAQPSYEVDGAFHFRHSRLNFLVRGTAC